MMVAEAAVELAAALLTLRRSPTGRIPRLMAGSDGQAASFEREPAAGVARAVDRAARLVPFRSTCLARSVALCRMLKRRGMGHRLELGVRPARPGEPPEFHAWVEHGGMALGVHAGHLGFSAFRGPGRNGR
jgi:hypothetical protein